MKADAITARILEDARTAAAKTLNEARERADAVKAKSEQTAIDTRENIMEQTRRECVELRDRMLRMAELEQRKELLAMKREVVDSAFDAAAKRLRKMPPKDARAFNMRLLAEASEGGEEIIFEPEDANIFDADFLSAANKVLGNAGKAPLAYSAEKRATGGGFLLSRGGMEINMTYRALLSQIRPSIEGEVAGLLFD